jgi:hypothetical protein
MVMSAELLSQRGPHGIPTTQERQFGFKPALLRQPSAETTAVR